MTRTKSLGRLTALAAGCLVVVGCDSIDPYKRAGMWQPAGVNDANLALMVARPADLAQGRGDAGAGIKTGASAVERLWKGTPAPAANASASQASPTPAPAPPGPN